MKNTYKFVWSEEAISNLQGIIHYLEYRWTEREIRNFTRLLDKKLKLIQSNPQLFPKSEISNELKIRSLSGRRRNSFKQP